jgi:hypothetical protein
MMHPIRPVILLGILFAASIPLRALPFSTGSVDRDIVRDPYSSFSLNLSKGPVIAVPSASAANFGSAFAGAIVPTPLGMPSFSNAASINGFLTSSMPFSFVPPPRNPPVYFALFDQPRQSNIQIGPLQVPDGGATMALLGASLLALFLYRRARVEV